MHFSSTLALLLALAPASIVALPARESRDTPSIKDVINRRALSSATINELTDGSCDLTGVTMPTAPTPLPPVSPGLTLYHVAIGRGTQNYTCKTSLETDTPTAIGAKATLFNATCASVRSPGILASTPNLALAYPIPTSDTADVLLSGHHFFLNNTTPFFTLDTDVHTWGSVATKKVSSSLAPSDAPAGDNGMGSVAWLKLSGFSGDFKEVYRLNTAGGNPPKNCSGIQGTFEVNYAAVYYLWK